MEEIESDIPIKKDGDTYYNQMNILIQQTIDKTNETT